ncbi:DUF4231 domain-containing protein [Fodinicurvata halophila]|uniref:DUF4231 domain-containing protein n=1 Tax=Fodinicurvata halophila TaxID=1419723 RepID=A0ABV8UNZ7_9PROT
MTESPYIAPRLTIRVGITGHRPNNLEGVDTDLLRQRIGEVLGCIKAMGLRLQEENNALGEGAPLEKGVEPSLRFVTALAAGSDSFGARAAIGEGYALNVILPFREDVYRNDFEGEALAEFERLLHHERVSSHVELHVTERPQAPAAYRSAGHLILAHSDLLIAVWNEQPGDGIGGTADIIHEARRTGLPVVLIALDGRVKLWSMAADDFDPVADGCWQPVDILDDGNLCPGGLASQIEARLLPLIAPPGAAVSASQTAEQEQVSRRCLQQFRAETLRPGSHACGYNLLRFLFTAKDRHKVGFSRFVDYRLAEERRDQWQTIAQTAADIGDEAFAETIRERLKERWLRADNVALHYSHVFRTAFIANFVLAALAVLIGLLILFFDSSLAAKAILVILELMCIGAILFVTARGQHREWHNRWLDYRNVAEVLRPACLPILMGSSPARPGLSVGVTPGQEWVAWYVRSSLREIEAPAHAVIGPEQLQAVLAAAVTDEIEGQIDYHRKNEMRAHDIDHRLEWMALCMLWAVVASGAVFLLVYGGALVVGCPEIAKAIKPLATFLGGVLPVAGAALYGIRATGDFRASSHQSARTLAELERLKHQFEVKRTAAPATDPDGMLQPSRSQVRSMLTQLGRVMTDDLKVWGMIFSERELGPGF